MSFWSTYSISTIILIAIFILVGLKIAKWIFWSLAVLAIVALIAFGLIF